MDNLILSINSKYNKNDFKNINIICIKSKDDEILFYIEKINKILYIQQDNRDKSQLYCYKSKLKATLNLDKNDWFSFICDINFNSKEESTSNLIKTILNQYYFLKPYSSTIYNDTEEYKIWEKYIDLEYEIIKKKDFYFIASKIDYQLKEAIVDNNLDKSLKNKLKKGMQFKYYIKNSIDTNLDIARWDEEYLIDNNQFGTIIKIDPLTFELDYNFNFKEQDLILRSSFFGDTIQINRQEDTLKKMATHTFGQVIFNNTKLKNIPKKSFHKKIQFYTERLNLTQKEAIQKAIQSDELFLIQGPPGTGKTSVITEIVLQEVKQNKKVLISSQMNLAIDEPLKRIRELNNKVRIKQISKYDTNFNDENANIYGATLSKCGSKEFRDILFDTVIIDEVSKATPLELMIPILISKKVILVGDHKQLPPQINNESIDIIVEELNILDKTLITDKSIFEKLIDKYESISIMLDTQYRMHPEIAKTIEPFYDNKLKNGIQLNNLEKHTSNHVLWKNSKDNTEIKVGTSYINKNEIQHIKSYLETFNMLYTNKKPTIGIITFYGAQVNLLQQEIKINNYKNIKEIKIDSVDRFQGQEKDIIILSMVRSNKYQNIGFAKSPNRINVAFSRAKNLLIIIGNKNTFSGKQSQCKHVIELCEKKYGIGACKK